MNWNELLPILDKNFNTDRCMKHVYSICDTDRWFDYSKNEETAAYCADAMRKAGFSEVELLPMKADGKTVYCDWKLPKAWKAYHGKLRFADGEEICDYHKKPCSLVMYTPSADNIEGEVIEVTDLNDLSDKYNGKIILTSADPGSALNFAEKVGAIGILSDSVALFPGIRDTREDFYDDCTWQGFGGRGSKTNVFGFKLTPRQGDMLREKLKSETVRVAADIKTEFYDGIQYTISGAVLGTDPTLPEVFAYGHLYEPGANDNAAGGAALIEILATINESIEKGILPRPKRTIRIGMGSECTGSMGYLAMHPERKLLCSIVADMIGTETIDRTAISIRYAPISAWSFADAAIDAIDRISEEYEGTKHNFKRTHLKDRIGTDNIITDPVFFAPCVAMVASPALSYHSSMDTPDRIEPDIVRRNAAMIGTYLYGLAAADDDTCEFLADEIEKLYARQCEGVTDTRKLDHNREARDRALYSLHNISCNANYPMQNEEKYPVPEYAMDKCSKIPVRTVKGCLTMALYPPKKESSGIISKMWGRFNPGFNPPLTVPLFWIDGKRNLWEVAVQSALEKCKCSDDEIREEYEVIADYCDFLAELGYIEWKM